MISAPFISLCIFSRCAFLRVSACVLNMFIYVLCEQNTFPRCLYRHKHFVRASHMMLHAHAWLKLCLPSKTFSHSCHLSRAPCHLTRTARFPCRCLPCLPQPHLLFLAHAQRRFNQERAAIHTASEVTVLRNPNLAHVVWLHEPRMCMYACMYVCMYVKVHINRFMYVHLCACFLCLQQLCNEHAEEWNVEIYSCTILIVVQCNRTHAFVRVFE